jgi:serine/threonine protein kinase
MPCRRLGVVIYEMIAGMAPFEGQTTADRIAAILEREPSPLAQYSTEVPEALHGIETKALRKDKEERYQTASEPVPREHCGCVRVARSPGWIPPTEKVLCDREDRKRKSDCQSE